ERLLRLRLLNTGLVSPSGSSASGGGERSPPPGRSLLITAAPYSANIWVQHGPIMSCVKSSTFTPLSGWVALLSLLIPQPSARWHWRPVGRPDRRPLRATVPAACRH